MMDTPSPIIVIAAAFAAFGAAHAVTDGTAELLFSISGGLFVGHVLGTTAWFLQNEVFA